MIRNSILLPLVIAACALLFSPAAEAGDNVLPQISLVPSWVKIPKPPTPKQCWNGFKRNSEDVVKSTIALPGQVLTGARDLLMPWARPQPTPAVRIPLTGSRGFTTRGQTAPASKSFFSIPSWLQKTEPSRPSSTIQEFLAQPRVK
tara:strand:+ start:169 stop:606 length:438 start_codon:yes stop_codon:yes gene_type:complete